MNSNAKKHRGMEEKYYILTTDRPGKFIRNGILQHSLHYLSEKSTNSEMCYHAQKGEIFKDGPIENQPKDEHRIQVISVEKDNVILEASTVDLVEIPFDVAKLLLPVQDHEARYGLFTKRNFTANALDRKVGEKITVEHDGSLRSGKIKQIKNEMHGKLGTFFTVELEIDKDVIAVSHGKKIHHKGVIDVVTTVDKLFPPNASSHGQTSKSSKDNRTSMLKRFKKFGIFEVGMKISVFSENKPLQGTIKFIGKAAFENDVTFGIELESPAGNSDGTFHGEKVMDCKPYHAIFASKDELIDSKYLEDDEHGNYVVVDDHAGRQLNQATERTDDDEIKGKSERSAGKSGVRVEGYGSDSKLNLPYAGEGNSLNNVKDRTQKNSLEVNGTCKSSYQRQISTSLELNGTRKSSFTNQMSTSDPIYRLNNGNYGFQRRAQSGPHSLSCPPMVFDDNYYSDRYKGRMLEDQHHSNIKVPRRGSDTALNKKDSESYDPSLQVDSVVQVSMNGEPKYGLIKWIGYLDGVKYTELIAGLELEEPCADLGDGRWINKRYFTCPTGRAFFVKLSKCKKDERFTSTVAPSALLVNQSVEELNGNFLPPSRFENVQTGRMRGIQGHHNSCYLDSTLFAMFAFSMVFDSVLYRKKKSTDIEEYEQVQNALKNAIVNPLRVNGFVNAASVLRLRGWLDKLANVPGFMNEEKDPEEFLMLLLKDVLQVDPFLLLRTNQNSLDKSYFYQILVEREEHNPLPTLQYLFELSFFTGSICLEEVPSVLVIQLPRSGLQKMYKRIRINPTLDVSNVMSHAQTICFVCGKEAEYSCKECRMSFGWDRPFVFFCPSCKDLFHQNSSRISHQVERIKKIKTSEISPECTEMKRLELFAVVCIQTSHYVTFARCGDPPDDKWVFFDSMADRVGEEAGHNVPEIVECPEVKDWLHKSPLTFAESDSKNTPEKVIRLFEDASLCFYKSSGLSMYR